MSAIASSASRFARACSTAMSRRALVGSGLLLAATPAAAVIGGGAPAGPTVTVGTAAELVAAARAAGPGTTILLLPGTYGHVNLSNIVKSGGGIVIRPATTTVPRFASLSLAFARGIAVANVAVVGSLNPLVNLSGGSDLEVAGLTISGTPNANPWDDANTGMWIRLANRVCVTNCRFQDLRAAVYVQRSAGVIIADCTFHYLREGINACASRQLLIRRNRFQLFLPNYAAGEHPDAIQFWMSGETEGMTDVVLAQNFLAFGDQRAVQGLFLATGYVPPELQGRIFHEHMEVRDNIYYGASSHGITVSLGRNVLVWRNSILASPHADVNRHIIDPTGRISGGFQPQLIAFEPNGVRVERNISTFYNLPPAGVTHTRNVKLWDSQTRTGEPHSAIFGARPTASIPTLSEFRVRPGSVAAALGAGATPPARAGAWATATNTVLAESRAYAATLGNFGQWFSRGF